MFSIIIMGHFHYSGKFGSMFASIPGPIFAALYLFQTTLDYYMFPLQRTSTHLVILEGLSWNLLKWKWNSLTNFSRGSDSQSHFIGRERRRLTDRRQREQTLSIRLLRSGCSPPTLLPRRCSSSICTISSMLIFTGACCCIFTFQCRCSHRVAFMCEGIELLNYLMLCIDVVMLILKDM
jgi:hypothetical protein